MKFISLYPSRRIDLKYFENFVLMKITFCVNIFTNKIDFFNLIFYKKLFIKKIKKPNKIIKSKKFKNIYR